MFCIVHCSLCSTQRKKKRKKHAKKAKIAPDEHKTEPRIKTEKKISILRCHSITIKKDLFFLHRRSFILLFSTSSSIGDGFAANIICTFIKPIKMELCCWHLLLFLLAIVGVLLRRIAR